MKKVWFVILLLSFIGLPSTVYAMSACCVCLDEKDCFVGTCCKSLHLCFDCEGDLLKTGRSNDFACPLCGQLCTFLERDQSVARIKNLLENKILISRQINKTDYANNIAFEKVPGKENLLNLLVKRYGFYGWKYDDDGTLMLLNKKDFNRMRLMCCATVMSTLVTLGASCSLYRSISSKNRLSSLEREVASSQKKLLAFDFDMFGSLFVSPLTNRYTVQELSSGIPDEQLRATLAIAIEEYENVYYSIYLKIMSEYYFKPAFDLATKEPELVASLKQKAAQLQSVIDSCKQKVSTRLINWVTAGSGIAISAVAGYGAYRMRRLA